MLRWKHRKIYISLNLLFIYQQIGERMNKEKKSNYFAIISIVAIVAIVGLVVIFANQKSIKTISSTEINGEPNLVEENIAGEATARRCTDSDGGKNYYVKGKCTDKYNVPSADLCVDNTILNEKYCTSTKKCAYERYRCPNGCNDGICLKKYYCSSDKECTNLNCPQVVGGDKPKCDLTTNTCYCGGICGDGYCDSVEKRDGTCRQDCIQGCGNCICELDEKTTTCKEDCDFGIVSFYPTVTEDRARNIINSCYGLTEKWFSFINAASIKVNRCTAFKFKECMEKYAGVVKDNGVQLSKYSGNALVVLNYGLGARYNNSGKCNIKGWHDRIIYQTKENPCVQQGQAQLPDSTFCFYWEAVSSPVDNERYAYIYIAKIAKVIQNTVNTGDNLELISSIPIEPIDSLPMTAVISDFCIEPNNYNDKDLQQMIDNIISFAFPECNLNPSNVNLEKPKGDKTCLDGSEPYCLSENECYCFASSSTEGSIQLR